MVVNRTLRDKLAEGLQAFMRREIDSYDFDDIVLDTGSCSCLDQDANRASDVLWHFYDDFKIHHINVSKEGWEYLKRWYAFLKTNYSLEERTFFLGRWYMPWILLSIFLCAGLIAWRGGDSWILLFLYPLFGVIMYFSYRRRLAKDERFVGGDQEYVRLSRFAPFVSEEDWHQHKSLVDAAAIPPYEPAVHGSPYRSPVQELRLKLMTFIGFVLLFPLEAVLSPLLRESKYKLYLRVAAPPPR